MQQVDYKEGFMKGSVQLCSIDETPVHARHDRFINSIPPKKEWHLLACCVRNLSYLLISNCTFISTESVSLKINNFSTFFHVRLQQLPGPACTILQSAPCLLQDQTYITVCPCHSIGPFILPLFWFHWILSFTPFSFGFSESCDRMSHISPGACPEFCIEIFQPVCGSNGETYSNECYLQMVRISYISRY